MEKYIHTNIFTRKTPVMVSFLVWLQPWGLTTLLKSDSLLDVFVKFAKFYRISFLQKTAGRLVPISSNISDISLTLLAINQLSHNCLSRTSTKSGSLAIHSVNWLKENFFLAEVELRTKNGYLAEALTQKRSEIFGKTHGKTPVLESFFSLQAWNFIKETPV